MADQWLLSAIGILTGHPHLLRSLFRPTRQEAAGRYCVRLFKEANWINVFVDTLIACNASGHVRRNKTENRIHRPAAAKTLRTQDDLKYVAGNNALRCVSPRQ